MNWSYSHHNQPLLTIYLLSYLYLRLYLVAPCLLKQFTLTFILVLLLSRRTRLAILSNMHWSERWYCRCTKGGTRNWATTPCKTVRYLANQKSILVSYVPQISFLSNGRTRGCRSVCTIEISPKISLGVDLDGAFNYSPVWWSDLICRF